MGYYSFGEVLKNCFSYIYTKMFYKKARLVRLPFYVRNKKYINFGHKMTTGYRCRFEVENNEGIKRLFIGNNVSFGDNVRISCYDKISIGNNVLIASNVLIVDNAHGTYSGDYQSAPNVSPNDRELSSSPISIGNNVWIGQGAVIQQGVFIGDGSIIAANSVVTKNVSPNSIVGGIPASILKVYDFSKKQWVRSR